MFPPHPLFMAAPLSTFPATSHSPHHRHTSHVDRRRCRAAANMDATIRTDSHAKIHTTRMHGTNVPGGNCVSMGTPSHTSTCLRNLLFASTMRGCWARSTHCIGAFFHSLFSHDNKQPHQSISRGTPAVIRTPLLGRITHLHSVPTLPTSPGRVGVCSTESCPTDSL